MAEEIKDLDDERELVEQLWALIKNLKVKGIVVQLKGGIRTPTKMKLNYR